MAGGAIKAGMAFIELGVRDLTKKALTRTAKKIKALGASMANIGKKMAAVGALMAAPFAMGIKAASDMQETMSKFDTVFGSAAGSMKVFSDELADRLGRSKLQMAGFLSSMQDLLVPMGMSASAAMDMSKGVSQLAVDLASFNNLADADVFNDLQAALTGSGEVMKKYGVVMSVATVNQQLWNAGLDPKFATEAQKAQARYNIVLAGTTAAQGDAERTGGSFANQVKRLQAQVSDTFAAIGAAILPVATKVINVINKVMTFFKLFVEASPGVVAAVAAIAAGLIGLGSAMAITGIGVTALTAAASALATVVGAVLSPIGAVIAILVALGVALAAGVGYWLAFTESGNAVIDWFKNQFGEIAEIARTTIGGVFAAIATGDFATASAILWKLAEVVWKTAMVELQKLYNNLMENVFGRGFLKWIESGIAKWKMIFSDIKTTVMTAVDAVSALIKGIANLINKIPGMKTLMGFFGGGLDDDKRDELAARLDERAQAAKRAKNELQALKDKAVANREESEKAAVASKEAEQAEVERRGAEQEEIDKADNARRRAEADAKKAEEDAEKAREKGEKKRLKKIVDDAKKKTEKDQANREKRGKKIVDETARRDEMIKEQKEKHADFVAKEGARRTSTATFSAAAVGRLGQVGIMTPQKETAANTKQIAKSNERIAALLQQQEQPSFT
tara:strand:- start:2886 stop:4925 length:2040 start_codon:yes stop_codon:yes gene_type:complete